MKEISQNWTPEERLEVVNKIAKEMWEERFPLPNDVKSWAERLALVAGKPSGFLNANRKQIIGN